jgi:hypothetical protein
LLDPASNGRARGMVVIRLSPQGEAETGFGLTADCDTFDHRP